MTRNERLGAIAWTLSLQFFAVQAIVQSAWDTPFSLAHNMISDLARETCGHLYRAPGIDTACSPWHALMNASIALNGLLIPLGAWLTRALWPRRRGVAIGLVMIALTAPGHLLAAGYPSDTGPTLHVLGAGSILALGNPGMVVAGWAMMRERRGAATASIALGVGGIAGTLLFLGDNGLGLGLGGMERVAFYPLTIWCGLLGVALFLRREAKPAS